MLETSARLLKLLSLLQSPRDWSGAALAAELGVGVRTVRRDVEKLRNLGYPVDALPGVAGYRLGAGAALPPLLLDDEEAVAVAIGLRAAATGSVAGIEESSVRALTKLEQVLPSRLRHRIKLLQAVAVTPAGGPSVAAGRAARGRRRVAAITSACASTTATTTVRRPPVRRSRIDSCTRAGAGTWSRGTWTAPTGARSGSTGWSRGSRPGRASLRARSRTWAPPLVASRPVATGTRPRFLVQAPAEQVADRFAPSVATVTPVDATTTLVEAGANSLDELALHLGLLGHPFEVQSPPELIEHVQAWRRAWPPRSRRSER